MVKPHTKSSENLLPLVQKAGGLFSSISYLESVNGDIPISTCVVKLGCTECINKDNTTWKNYERDSTFAAGTGLDPKEAVLPALMEGVERYCASLVDEDKCIWSLRDDLAEPAIDLNEVPKCSASELSHPKCPLKSFDSNKPIRWVRGVSLLTGRTVCVPAVMVYNRPGYASVDERFWIPISTGCAAHWSYERALLNGILEVIERDAISVTWLQRLSLPHIELDTIPPSLSRYWDAYQNSCSDIEYAFFDATSDLGVPTVYGLQVAREDQRVTTLVACSTDMDAGLCIAKVMRDLASLRIAFKKARSIPSAWDDYNGLMDGATYMAKAEQLHAFDFLLGTTAKRRLSEMPMGDAGTDSEQLRRVLSLLKMNGMEAFAVDLTKDEAARYGIKVVRVVIPKLQPLSFSYRARYLGHSRLYDMPAKLGYPVYAEADVNPWPQPFA